MSEQQRIAMIATKQRAPSPGVPNLILLLVRFREVGILFFTLLLVFVVSLISKQGFLTVDNFLDILLNISILAIVGLAQMMVIITRGIDLSVGSVIGLVAMIVAFTMVAFPELNQVLALVLGVASGAVLGSVNAAVITRV